MIPGSGACWQCGNSYTYSQSQSYNKGSAGVQNDKYANNKFRHQREEFYNNHYSQNNQQTNGNHSSYNSQARFNSQNSYGNNEVNEKYNQAYEQDSFDNLISARLRAIKNQRIFAIVNMVLGVFSLVFVGLFLGIFALIATQRAVCGDNSQKRINQAFTLNLIAFAISLIAIVAIVLIAVFFWEAIFTSGFIYY